MRLFDSQPPRLLPVLLLLASAGSVRGADVADFQREFLAGKYEQVIEEAQAGVLASPDKSEWHQLLVRGLLAVGRYPEADAAMAEAMARDTLSIRLRWLAREVALANGRPDDATKRAEEIRQFMVSRSYAYRNPADLVVFGRAALLAGADPKDVLEKVYAVAQKGDPKLREVYLARGELALEKHDSALAARAFEEGQRVFPDDPDFLYGLSRSFENGDRGNMLALLEAALKANPRHVPSLLKLAEHRIDAEDYDGAGKILDQVKAVNPANPDAWAFRAVIAHLRNNPASEKAAREQALAYWKTNPRVDHLLGKKLAEKYRFAEAAGYQRQALQFAPGYLPAKAELSSNLLRLGDEAEGWALAREVHLEDGYDVEAYNLVTLEETMAKYATLNDGDFVVRMASQEAGIYGSQVLELLGRARRSLTEKYGIEELARPTYVEIFADQKDFAVRTFGMPDVAGFLGVCFGRVVTANSPAASPANWQAVLWHEFCHVVTLQLTQNKMPRWLSEGISVYEETQANSSWGMRVSPRFREMIMGEELVPVSQLSAAFLAPPTPVHLQFAYFESSLVVEYLVERHGLPALRAVLADLRKGIEINDAIAAHTAPMAEIEKEFTAYARAKIQQVAPGLDWAKPPPKLLLPGAEEKMTEWSQKNPNNLWALSSQSRRLMVQRKWEEAKAVLQRQVELYPTQTGADSAWRLLAATYRAIGDTDAERRTLVKFTEVDNDAPEACLRLMELSRDAKDWRMVEAAARRYLAINPLVLPPYRFLGQASTELGDLPTAIGAYRTVLKLDPTDPAEAHFLLAQLLHRVADPEAKRQVLEALEEAPRYRSALDLLLEINRSPALEKAPVPPSVTLPPPVTPRREKA